MTNVKTRLQSLVNSDLPVGDDDYLCDLARDTLDLIQQLERDAARLKAAIADLRADKHRQRIVVLEKEIADLRDQLRWRDISGEA